MKNIREEVSGMSDRERTIKGVILDWAGTTVDYGCFAPLGVFMEIFAKREVGITLREARAPMGMLKIDHIRAILNGERVAKLWRDKFGREGGEEDVRTLYEDFEPSLMAILPGHADVIDGVAETVAELREDGIKIGSTTGYTREMMEILTPIARGNGYAPDCLVTAEDTGGAGRPYPYMLFRNMEKLGIYPPRQIVKVGDTVSDILEGRNAGVWSVGVIVGSSEMGLSWGEYNTLEKGEREKRRRKAAKRFFNAGAHYVIRDMSDLPDLICKINRKLRKEED